MIDQLDDLVSSGEDPASVAESAQIYPLVTDSGNQRVLKQWLADHETYQAVDTDRPVTEAAFDLCIVDEGALSEYRDQLEQIKAAAQPVLLPVLLLLPETRADVIDIDGGQIADNVFTTTIDEIVSLPIKQAELEWRIQALLRLRVQSLNLERRTNTLELFQQAVDEAGYAVYITDPEGTIKYVNPAFEEITGYSTGEAVGQTPRMLNSGEMSEEYFEELWETVTSGDVWQADIVDRRKSGELYYASQTVAPITEGEETKAFVAVQTDITERKERKQRLERQTQAIESAPVGITISDPNQPDNPLIYVNQAFEELTGYTEEEALGENCRYLQGEETDPAQVEKIRAALDAEEPITVDILNYRKDGTPFWNRLTIAPVRGEDGTVVNYVGFQQDATERKEREQQLNVLGRVLRHNVRNAMNVIQGWAETMQAEHGAEISGPEEIIEKGAQLSELAEKEKAITDVLTDPPEMVTTDLRELVEHVVETIEAEYPDAEVSIDCPSVSTTVPANFESAVEELVRNAIVHNDSANPSVRITGERDDQLRLAISDNGPEIPEMERAVLLGEGDQTAIYHGSGLGLWLVNLIVSRSDGSLHYETVEPQGNCVEITLASEPH
jgi:PAS domain S-box-containing protein